ncbi:MAG: ACT domain-containing protein [Pseudomonadota bacterium]
MVGETDLDILIAGMDPELRPGVFVFATLPDGASIPKDPPPLMTFRESEGVTLILAEEAADAAGIEAVFRCRMITLRVHSALEAVGFIARIASLLASAGMGVNPVAGFHHDHLFVPEDRAEHAMRLLQDMAEAAR